MSVQKNLVTTIDKLIHPRLLEDAQLVPLVRLVQSMYLFVLAVLALFSLAIAIFPFFNEKYTTIALGFSAALVFFLLLSIFLIWKAGYFYYSCGLTLVSICSINFIAIYYSGGVMESPYNIFLLLAVMGAFLVLGNRVGIFVSLSVLIVELIFIMMDLKGFEFPRTELPLDENVINSICWIIGYIEICIMFYIVGESNSRLKKALDTEKDLFKYLACHDPLTDLDNRAAFKDKLDEAVSRAKRNDLQFAMLYLDLDGFKLVNDTLGHDAGDAVLKSVSERLTASLRKGDTLARLGGDEFAIILEDVKELNDINAMVKKILEVIAKPTPFNGGDLRVRSSIGVAIFPQHGIDPVVLTKAADGAMYRAKEDKPKTQADEDMAVGQFYLANSEQGFSF